MQVWGGSTFRHGRKPVPCSTMGTSWSLAGRTLCLGVRRAGDRLSRAPFRQAKDQARTRAVARPKLGPHRGGGSAWSAANVVPVKLVSGLPDQIPAEPQPRHDLENALRQSPDDV